MDANSVFYSQDGKYRTDGTSASLATTQSSAVFDEMIPEPAAHNLDEQNFSDLLTMKDINDTDFWSMSFDSRSTRSTFPPGLETALATSAFPSSGITSRLMGQQPVSMTEYNILPLYEGSSN